MARASLSPPTIQNISKPRRASRESTRAVGGDAARAGVGIGFGWAVTGRAVLGGSGGMCRIILRKPILANGEERPTLADYDSFFFAAPRFLGLGTSGASLRASC